MRNNGKKRRMKQELAITTTNKMSSTALLKKVKERKVKLSHRKGQRSRVTSLQHLLRELQRKMLKKLCRIERLSKAWRNLCLVQKSISKDFMQIFSVQTSSQMNDLLRQYSQLLKMYVKRRTR